MAIKTGTPLAEVLNSTAAHDRLVGLGGDDTLNGNGGNDTLEGGAGNDQLAGGAGNDIYIFATGGGIDTIFEEGPGGGTDTLRSAVSVASLAANVENLILTGTLSINGTGNSLHNAITGNTKNNKLNGGVGNDTVDGGSGNDSLIGGDGNDSLKGGAGADTMLGGAGNDTYVVDSALDKVTESATGADTVQSSVTFTLATAGRTQIEQLTLQGAGHIKGTGNTLANTITGNEGNNTLLGAGGNDRLSGGVGNDKLNGDANNDSLVGGAGNDTLEGGTGMDTLLGGAGNDVISWDAADAVRDGGASTDTLRVTGIDPVNLASGPVANMEIVDLAGTNMLTVSVADILAGFTNDTLKVNGGAGDAVIAGSGWTRIENTGNYVQYTKDGATLQVDADIDRSGIGVAVVSSIGLADLDGDNGFRLDGIAAEDKAGYSVAFAGDVNGDGYDDLIIGAFGADLGDDTAAGASYVVFGDGDGIASSLDLATLDGTNGFAITGAGAGDASGFSVASAGDVNGDGFADLIVGAVGSEAGAGAAYVVFGREGGFAPELDLDALDGTTGFRLRGEEANEAAGSSVASAGDLNGDGYADLVVGAPAADGNYAETGAAYVVFGASTFASGLDLSSLDGTLGFKISGLDIDDEFGDSVAAAGDVDGDGYDDLLVGAPGGDPGLREHAGEAYIVFGRADLAGADLFNYTDSSNQWIRRLEGIEAGIDLAGGIAAGAGDVNGDGRADMIVGGASYRGFVVFGQETMVTSLNLSALNGDNGFRLAGNDEDFTAISSIAPAGDVNGDGYDDLVVGTFGPNDGGPYSGESYVVFGGADFDSSLSLMNLDGADGFRIEGIAENDRSGQSVFTAGDMNGDGFADLIIGAHNGGGTGQAFVLYGRDFTGAVSHLGGSGMDVFAGGAGAEVFVAGRGNDTMTGGGGADVFRGGAGDDHIVLGAGDPLRADGGSGTDTLRLVGADRVLNLTVPGAPISDIEVIDLTGSGNNTLTLDVPRALQVTGGSTLRVTGNSGDTVNIGEGWHFEGIFGDGGQDYLRFTSGGAVLELDADLASDAEAVIYTSSLDGLHGFEFHEPEEEGYEDGFAGWSIAGAGDVNHDGLDDLLVGAPGLDLFAANAGGAFLVFGEEEFATEDFDFAEIHGNLLMGGDQAGFSVASAGDVDGDGEADFLIGVPNWNDASEGAAFVVPGGAFAGSEPLPLHVIGAALEGGFSDDQTGSSVSAAGDVNGDGYGDLLIGAYGRDVNGANAGAAYVVFGGPSVTSDDLGLDTLTGANGFEINGESAQDFAGFSVSGAGDVNGDGVGDLLIGARDRDVNGTDAGAAYVVFGRATGFGASFDLSALNGANGFELNGGAAGDLAGASVASAGDVNGDTYDDLVIGAPGRNGGAGSAYVVFGRASGFAASVDLSSLGIVNGFEIRGGPGEKAGFSVSSAGDLNGDGFDDVAVGAPFGGGGSSEGAGYVIFGRNFTGTAVIDGDLAGSAGDDVIKGGLGDDTITAGAGDDHLLGGGGDDDLEGGGDDDVIEGSAGNDVIRGGTGIDRLYGGNGDDTLDAGAGDDFVIHGGYGFDTLRFEGAASIQVDLALETVSADGSGLSVSEAIRSIEAVIGGAAADELLGDTEANRLEGLGGTDLLAGSIGSDTLEGGGDADTLVGGEGNDTVAGGEGADVFMFDATPGAADADLILDFAGAGAEALDLIVLITSDEAFETLEGFPGELAEGEFESGAGLTESEEGTAIVYDTTTGNLYYDGFPLSMGNAVLFATLAGSPDALSASDFFIIPS